MSESAYQAKVVRGMEKDGWYCVRLIQTNKNGIPDVVCFRKRTRSKYPEVKWIEFKAVGKKLRPLQTYRHKEIEQMTGCKPEVMIEP